MHNIKKMAKYALKTLVRGHDTGFLKYIWPFLSLHINVLSTQTRIQNPVEHLRWSFLRTPLEFAITKKLDEK